MMSFTAAGYPGIAPSDPAFYTHLFNRGVSGKHIFDAWVLDFLSDLYNLTHDANHNDGEVCSIRDKISAQAKASFLIHRNGRQGSRDLSKDSAVIPTTVLKDLPEEVQTILYGLELVPGGRRA